MPKFQVEHKSQLSADEAFKELDRVLSEVQEIKKFDPKAEWTKSPKGEKKGLVKSPQFQAEVEVLPEGSGSRVVFSISVSVLLMPLKGVITETLTKKLQKYLA